MTCRRVVIYVSRSVGVVRVHSSTVVRRPTKTSRGRSSTSEQRWPIVVSVALVLALVGGIVLRFVTSSPMWIDEALSINIASLGPSGAVTALRHDGHPVLYYLLLGWWTDLFGGSDFAARSLSGVFSLATVPVLAVVANRRYGSEVARHTLALSLAAPFLIRYGTEARMYSMLVFLVALGWLLLDRATEQPTVARLVPVALVSAALVHTHYWTFWLITAVALSIAWRWRAAKPGTRSTDTRLMFAVAAGASTIIVWLPVLIDQAAHTGTPWAPRARPAEVLVEAVQAIGGGRRFEPMLLGILLLVAAVLGATYVGRTDGELRISTSGVPSTLGPAWVTAATLAIGGAASLVLGGAFEARYAAVVVPFLIVLSARGTSALGRRAAPAALALLVLGGLFVGADEARRDRSQGQEVATAIDSLAQPGDIVAFCPDQLAPPTLRYLQFDGPALAYPPGFDPRRVDWRDYLDRISASDPVAYAADLDQEAGDHAIFLVFNSTYSGFEGRCETIVNALTDIGRDDRILVNGRAIFQPMFLRLLGPAK